MVYYKDLDNKIHVLGSTDFRNLLPTGCVEITQSESNVLLEPTSTEQLASYRISLKTNRDDALGSLTHEFGDGRVMQVRPTDAGNIQIAIGVGIDQEWVMDDNSVSIVTPTELQVAFDTGVQSAMVIWSDYMTALKAL